MYMDPGKRLSVDEADFVEAKLVETCKARPTPYESISMKDFIRSLGWGYGRMPDVRRHLDSPCKELRARLTHALGVEVGDIFCTRQIIHLHKIPLSSERVSQDESEARFQQEMTSVFAAFGVGSALASKMQQLGTFEAALQSTLEDVVNLARREGVATDTLQAMMIEALTSCEPNPQR